VTFLNPAFLFGLLGMSIPLLIHLLSRRTARRVDFSTLEFLRDLERKSLRRVRVRQWLLLAIRMLLIAAVALAMARPTLTGVAAGGGKARTSAVIVLDGSFSMSASDGGPALFEAAKERAADVLATLEDGDEVVMLVPGAPEQGSPEFAHDLSFVRERVAGASPGLAAADLVSVLRDAFRTLEGARHPNREVHVVSDFQRSGWDGLEGMHAPAGVGVYLHPVGEAAPPNAWIDSVDFSGQILEKGTPLEFRVVVASGAAHPRADVEVEMEVDGRVADRRQVDLAPGSRVALSLRETFAQDGLHLGTVLLRGTTGPDADDRRRFTLRTAAAVPVLVVSGDDRARLYLETALAPPGSTAGSFAVRAAPPTELRSASRGREAVIVLADVGRLEDRELDGLKAFLSEGGGLLVFPGPHFDAAAWGRSFLPRFLPGTLAGLVAPTEPFRIEKLDGSHPLFDVFREGDGGLRDVRFTRALQFRGEAGSVVLASYSTGDPAIVESALLPGRVLFVTSSVDPGWSDLPVTGAFLPLLHESVRYLSESRGGGAERLDVGEGAAARLPSVPAGGVTLVTPSGSTRAVVPEPGTAGYALVLPEADEPGFYVFRAADADTIAAFAANVAARESDFTRIAPKEVEESLDARGRVLAGGTGAVREIEEARRGREIGRAFLWAAAVLLLLESLLAMRTRPLEAEA
jgi:hypothetical protein